MITFAEMHDIDLIESLLKSDDMWCRISEDGQDRDSFHVPENDTFKWIGAYADDELIGMYFFHPLNLTTWQAHAHIIKEHRREYSRLAGAGIVKYFIDELPADKLIVEIPEIYKNVYNYVKHLGFIDEGINRKSYTKNGEIIDQYRLGLTKEEAIEWLKTSTQ